MDHIAFFSFLTSMRLALEANFTSIFSIWRKIRLSLAAHFVLDYVNELEKTRQNKTLQSYKRLRKIHITLSPHSLHSAYSLRLWSYSNLRY